MERRHATCARFRLAHITGFPSIPFPFFPLSLLPYTALTPHFAHSCGAAVLKSHRTPDSVCAQAGTTYLTPIARRIASRSSCTRMGRFATRPKGMLTSARGEVLARAASSLFIFLPV